MWPLPSRRYRDACLCVGVLFLALHVFVAGCARRTTQIEAAKPPDTSAAGEPSEVAWWFPSELRVGCRQHFRIDHTSTIIYRDNERHVDEHIDFVVEVAAPEPGKAGCVLRTPSGAPLLDPMAGITALAVRLFAAHSPSGIRVTSDAVLVNDVPLLRGPWRAGDRFSVFGFGVVVFLIAQNYLVGVMHFDVESVTPTSAHLSCQLWAGKRKPMLFGRGELTFESDAEGLKRVHAYWERTYGPEWREATVVIARVRIDEPGE